MSVLATLANVVTAAGAAPARVRFAAALRDPAAAQRAILMRTLRANADTAYGRAHGFASVRDERDFAARVPLVAFDELDGWMSRVAAGEAHVLTRDAVEFMEPTGGSSGFLKLIPYTSALRSEFSAAVTPWLFDLLAHRPALVRGRSYWAISPPGRRPAQTSGGIPVGMEDDADYFPAPLRALLRRGLAVPGSVARASDIATCRYLTLRALLAAPDLVLISVWSPSFLSLLTDALDEQFDALLNDMERGTFRVPLHPSFVEVLRRELPARPDIARSLRMRFGRRAPEDLGLVWDRLALISCWTEGHATRALAGVRERFPHVEIQGKGLLATEGVVSIPLFVADAPVAALTSHYLEFLDPRDGRVSPAHALDVGGTYEVALTTGGGLYRYRLRDLVRVEGMLHRAPLLSFQGRADKASDIAGEKLTAMLVERALGAATRATGIAAAFAMLAPSFTPAPHYRLYVEAPEWDAHRLADAFDRELHAAHHYALCRSLGQLGPVRGVSVHDGNRKYERACVERGQRSGAVKPPALDASIGWERVFECP
ncbi:MAG: GH3 auxin-responsive promoter family protein, partial [bacterium]